MNENNEIEDGEIEVFDKNNKRWKGEMKGGVKWNGKGVFEWDYRKESWECEGKFRIK